jgi:putative aldouronate transport system permease protein
MKIKQAPSRIAFLVVNYCILTLITLSCILPILHIFAISLSSATAASSGVVVIWPVDPVLNAYSYLISKKDFFHSVWISFLRVIVGTSVNMFMIFITAYPLSRSTADFRRRNAYMIYFAITMFISGGLIPTYMVIRYLGLLDNFWVFILPGAVNIWSVIVMMNFMRGIPHSLEEAAACDGAGHWRILFQVILPVSLPSIASLTLFAMIGHWNSWFDGIFYMNNVDKYPLATYLATQILSNNRNMTNMTPELLAVLNRLSDKTVRSAELFISIIPILVVYPFLQRYFVKGIVVGSVKE